MTQSLSRRHVLLTSAAAVAASATALRAQTAETPALSPEAAAITVEDFGIGDKAAKVQIEEFLSFTCPHCEHFHRDVYPLLKADYIDTGKVRLTYHEVYFDQYGLLAAMAARCGGEMRYMGITDILYDTQKDWAGTDDIAVAVEGLKKVGRKAGMADDEVDVCLKDQAMAEALVAHYQTAITTNFPNDTFGGTPSFIINGTQYSNMEYADLKVIIDALLAA